MNRPGWSPVNLLAERALKRHNISQTITAADVCQAANTVGQQRWRAVSYADGKLKIIAPDYETVAKIKQTEPVIIQQINNELREPLVKKMICQLHWPTESDNLQP